MHKLAFATVAAISLATPLFAFDIDFTWDGLDLCTTGYPDSVPNPRFVLTDVPEGTRFIRFRLVDTDVPEFDHGGGVVAYDGQEAIEPSAFEYLSPCPPDGTHRYQWTATALAEETGTELGTASAERDYPE